VRGIETSKRQQGQDLLGAKGTASYDSPHQSQGLEKEKPARTSKVPVDRSPSSVAKKGVQVLRKAGGHGGTLN